MTDRYVVKFEIAYSLLVRYYITGIDNDHVTDMLGLLGEGCVSLMKEYVGTRNTTSHHNHREIDDEYIPAIKKEMSKIGIFNMATCKIRSRTGSGSGQYSTVGIIVDLTDISSNINYLKLKSPKHYQALMFYTQKKLSKDELKMF